jgi:DNA polymerase I-like protein with 3'-5' exonuclease and polymerase domains
MDKLFSECDLMFQNALFDALYFRHLGFKFPLKNIKHDTLLLHHAISPELPHNLGFIISLYGKTPYWKDDLLKRKVSIVMMREEKLRRYNLRDVVVLHQALPKMLQDLKETGTEYLYYNINMKLVKPIGKMMETGVLLDEKKLEKWKKGLIKQCNSAEQSLRAIANLPNAFNLSSTEDTRYFLFGKEPSKFTKLVDLPKKRKGTKIYQQLLELKEIKDKTVPIYIPTGYDGRTTGSGKIAVNRQGLLGLQTKVQNRLSQLNKLKRRQKHHDTEEKNIRKLLLWLEKLYKHRELSKLISTYTKFPVKPDGRIHTSYLIHGTSTARLASKNPNLQNIPKKEIEIRKALVVPDDKVMISADYSNLEVRILAYETLEPVLINAFETGQNIHDLNTEILFNLTPQDAMWKLARRAAKIFFFGGISYGGENREIYEKVILECPQMGLTFADYKRAKQNYMDRCVYYKRWRDKTIDSAVQSRTVRNC